MPKQRFIIIDGNALLHRAWHALPALTTKKGELVNAVYGFGLVFLKILKDLKPSHIVVTFDKKALTFRHKEFKEYKATRKKQPDELYQQIPRIKEMMEAFNVPVFEKEGYEADDLIGTFVKHTQAHRQIKANTENIIMTGDLDTLQLIDDNTKVYTLKRGLTESMLYDQEKVEEKYGLKPEQMVDFKALRGDPSDNIPGVKGIGEKTATDLLKKFQTLEGIYQNLEKIKESTRRLLEKYKKQAFLSKKLVTIAQDVPIKFDLADCEVRGFNRDKVINLFQELEFKSLLNKIPLSLTSSFIRQNEDGTKKQGGPEKKERYQLIDNQEKFEIFLAELKKQKAFALDTETTSLDLFQAKLLGISFCWKEGEAYYLKCQTPDIKCLKPILEDPQIKKYGHNIKFDLAILAEQGIDLRGAEFDTMIASYLLNPGSRTYRLDNLVFIEFGYQMVSLKNLIGEKKDLPMDEVPLKKLAHYSCQDADYTFRLANKLKKELIEKNLLNLLQKIEMPLVPILAQMERNGIKIDPAFLRKLSERVSGQLSDVKSQIYKLAGGEFNIASPQQLKEVLFNRLKISTQDIKKIKTGLSTAVSELEKLRGRHPIIDLIVDYRELSKLKSTYLDTLPELINPKTGRVHTNFNQTITATGRLSSSNPNLQNIPVRTELGRQIRKAFIAEKGYKLISVDYSQIELRVIAALANDQKMIKSFQQGEDIHLRTAAEIFDCSLDKVTPQMRRQAKIINFGIIYGMGSHGLSVAAGISQKEAKDFMERYFKIHVGIKEYIEQTKELVRSLGYAETLFGRRRWLPDIVSGAIQIKNAAERMAINLPVQGTAADIMKMAMIELSARINERTFTNELADKKDGDQSVSAGLSRQEDRGAVKMILQVHDELVFEIREDLQKEVSQIIKEIMENICKLKVLLEVDISVGDNWGEMKRLFF